MRGPRRIARSTFPILAAAAVLATSASAQIPPSLDTFAEVCGVTGTPLRDLARSTCAVISKAHMRPNERTALTYTIDGWPFEFFPPVTGTTPLCPGSQLFGQPLYRSGRSGVLVAPDVVLTAAHFVEPTSQVVCLDGWYFVFDYSLVCDLSGTPNPIPLNAFPGESVYECVEVIRHGAFDDNADFLLMRLDRPVTDRPPLVLRSTGTPSPTDLYVGVHHPYWMPTKVDFGVSFLGVQGFPPQSPMVALQGLHIAQGSSGGMVYNLDQGVIETVIRGGAGCLRFLPQSGCVMPQSQCSPGFGTIGPVPGDFARHIHPSEIAIHHPAATQVSQDVGSVPLFQPRVPHSGPIGGPYSNSVVEYDLSAPPWAPGPIRLQFDVHNVPRAPQLSYVVQTAAAEVIGPMVALEPGEHALLIVTVPATTSPAGIYEEDITVTNLENGNQDVLRHRFEIGLTGFTVGGSSFFVNDPSPPIPATQNYTLTNIHPSPVSVRIEAGATWLTINGIGAPSGGRLVMQTITLAPMGQPGSTANVVVGIGALSHFDFPAVYDSEIRFRNVGTAPTDSGNTQFPARLDTLHAGFGWFDSAVPIPDNDPRGVEIAVAVPDTFCIGDLDVGVSIGEFCFGPELGSCGWSAAQVIVELIAPNGRVVRLWDHHAGSSVMQVFDDATNPAPTGALLGALNETPAAGIWRLRVIDDVPGGGASICPPFSLQFESSGILPCGSQ